MDLQPGIQIARPLIPEEQYQNLTDHLPVVLILRTTTGAPTPPPPAGSRRIVAALPNPPGDDSEFDEGHLRDTWASSLALSGWRITNGLGQQTGS